VSGCCRWWSRPPSCCYFFYWKASLNTRGSYKTNNEKKSRAEPEHGQNTPTHPHTHTHTRVRFCARGVYMHKEGKELSRVSASEAL
jgi:hypothetical protein